MQKRQWPEWAIVLVLVIGFTLRIPLLNGSFWLDEAAQALEVTRPLHEQLNIVEDFQPPLLHLILHLAQYVSRTEWFLRVFAALIPGMITIYATYRIGKLQAGSRVGLLAALLLATSSFHLFYSQELRPYALPAMIATLSWWRVLQWSESKRRRFDPLFCTLTFLGCFSSYLYPFLLISQIAYVLFSMPKARQQLLGSLAVAGLGLLPWVPFFVGQFKQGTAVSAMLPGWTSIVGIPQLKSLPLVAGKFVFGVMDIQLSVPFVSAMVGILCLIGYVWAHTPQEKRKLLKPFVVWLALPVILAWLISFFVPILQPKRVLFSLPAMYLSVALLVEYADQHGKAVRRAALSLIIVLLSINSIVTASYFMYPKLQREDWRGLHRTITTQYSKENAVAVFSFPEPFAPWRWYDDGTFPTLSLGKLTQANQDNVATMFKPLIDGQYQYVLVFDYLRDITDPHNLIPTHLTELGYSERDVIDSPNIGFVRVFTRREAATAYDHRN